MRVDQYAWCRGYLVLGLVATGCSAPASNTEEAFQAMAVASLAQIEGETELFTECCGKQCFLRILKYS